MNAKWIFRDGSTAVECTSFPYAYRSMYNAIRKGTDKNNRKFDDMVKQMFIVAPIKDIHGKNKTYNYAEATQMATDQGLLTPDGQINSREFKRQY